MEHSIENQRWAPGTASTLHLSHPLTHFEARVIELMRQALLPRGAQSVKKMDMGRPPVSHAKCCIQTWTVAVTVVPKFPGNENPRTHPPTRIYRSQVFSLIAQKSRTRKLYRGSCQGYEVS